MAQGLRNRLTAGVTVVSNEFVDQYMAAASGEYVKVYLYLIRHERELPSVGAIADGLNLTEADVRRALTYWQRAGVLEWRESAQEGSGAGKAEQAVTAQPGNYRERRETEPLPGVLGWMAGEDGEPGLAQPGENFGRQEEKSGQPGERPSRLEKGLGQPGERPGQLGEGVGPLGERSGRPGERAVQPEENRGQKGMQSERGIRQALTRSSETEKADRAVTGIFGAADRTRLDCDLEALERDEAFSQLLYISQKYLNKTFTPTDCQVVANLYVNLKMSPELLEYLMEYCAQNNHFSLRYVEKVALSWHEKGIGTVEQAKAYSRSFSKDSFAVMKAMGLTGRGPADSEFALMEKWFRTFGFTKEIVVEACNRTIKAIHNPSFQYADRILTDWKKAGVRTVSDIEGLDRVRREKESTKGKRGKGAGDDRTASRGQTGRNGRTPNRFHNLEEHGYDYDEMVWSMINAGPDTGGGDGTQ